jgi:hypothetical protein
MAAELDVQRRRGLFYCRYRAAQFGHPLDRIVFSRLLAQHRRGVLHAAGLVLDGRGVILAGASGAGKTTAARWFAGRDHIVLSDERVVVGMLEAVPHVWGTPWHGDGGFAEPGPAPLHRIFLLEKDGDNTSAALSAAVACARLLSLCTVPYWNPAAAALVVDGVAETIDAAPAAASVLRLRDDASSVDFLLGCL